MSEKGDPRPTMPLPVAHSLMGYALSEATSVRLVKKKWWNVCAFVALANLPDIDYLPGFLMGQPNRFHHMLAHSFGFAALAGLLAGLIFWQLRRKAGPQESGYEYRLWPYFLIVSIAVLSHCLLDLFTVDTSAPQGMMLLWPLDRSYYDVSWDIFQSVHKSDASATFLLSLMQWYNFKIALWEALMMLPIVALAKKIRQLRFWPNRRRSRNLENTQVARLGLLEVSPLPPALTGRRSLTSLVEAAERDESEE
ncbi:MAG: metal-dependent hydrolase [candidate division KSB1 bacterium]|nr:metal-dependent hydrolase [candidate division KSB1 bacterium]MDZ7303587.1 metal-dependent hydrolase [candidate division KSB1 bacterium]MDZ7312830.1 metal-dependent hydrolase [candidate division KSB1 bacterium]